jgi:hypothetical protein
MRTQPPSTLQPAAPPSPVRAIVAYVVMYVTFAVTWLLVGLFVFTGWALWTSGVATNTPGAYNPEPLWWPLRGMVTVVALATAVLSARGFVDLSAGWRQKTRQRWEETAKDRQDLL